MHPRRTPKELPDVSHLFLSRSDPAGDPGSGPVEAVFWIAVEKGFLHRAFLASGFGTAFAANGMDVSLLEVGAGLPNVGYYFAMEPSNYLAPVVECGGVVTGSPSASLWFAYAHEPVSLLGIQREFEDGERPHVILLSFSFSGGGPDPELLGELVGCTVHHLRGSRGNRWPDGVLIFGVDDSMRPAERFIRTLRSGNGDLIVFQHSADSAGRTDHEVDEMLTLPEGLFGSAARRLPPSDPFFNDCAVNLLELLSYRRKRIVSSDANS